jgi:hypothetical protein
MPFIWNPPPFQLFLPLFEAFLLQNTPSDEVIRLQHEIQRNAEISGSELFS